MVGPAERMLGVKVGCVLGPQPCFTGHWTRSENHHDKAIAPGGCSSTFTKIPRENPAASLFSIAMIPNYSPQHRARDQCAGRTIHGTPYMG